MAKFGLGDKPHFQKFGDWDKVRQLVSQFPAEADRINKQSLMQFGLKAESIAVKMMQSQPGEWKKLDDKYSDRKIKKGLSEKILFATSTYFQSITTRVDGRVVHAGVFRDTKYKDGTPVWSIAAIHEYGSDRMNIKKRPLWKPAFIQAKNWVQKEKFFAKRLHDGMMKKFRGK